MKSLSLTKPHIITIIGLPGSGKTFFAEKFADMFSAPYVNLQKIADLATNTDAATSLFNLQVDELLKTKQSIVVEGKGETRAERMELSKKAKQNGYDTLVVWVQTDQETAKARASKAGKSTRAQNYETQAKRFSTPSATESVVVISGKHTYASQAKVVLKKLSSPRAEISTHTTPPVRAERTGRRNITIR